MTAYYKSHDKNGYIVAVSKKSSDINGPINSFISNMRGNIDKAGKELSANIVMIALLVGLAIMVFAFIIINNQIVDPMNRLSEAADKLTDGNFDVEMPDIKVENELKKFSSIMAMLVSIIKQKTNCVPEPKQGKQKKK